MAAAGVVLERPNRRRASSKVSKWLVVLLLLVSAGLTLAVTVGGWDALQGARAPQVAAIALYAVMALLVAGWSRGALPVAAALALVMLIFAAVSGPAWFDRDGPGFTDPALDAGTLGLVTLLIVPVQALLIVVAMVGFRQAWNVEVERRPAPAAAAPPPAVDESEAGAAEPVEPPPAAAHAG
ncbi:MAG: hypothetical protein QOH46_2370 [Solirubrobacteraceae bacterium]|nr:hypothetical protein [Solirubrobacteraceae bacterium]